MNDIRRLGVKHVNSHYSIAPNKQQNKWIVILVYCMYVHVSFISGSAAHITNKQTKEEAERWIDIKQTQANYSAKYSNTHLCDYYSFPLKCNRIVSGAGQSEKQCGEKNSKSLNGRISAQMPINTDGNTAHSTVY